MSRRRSGVAAAGAMALGAVPAPAAACAWCLSSAFGDQTYNWAYLGLLLMPFVLAAAIGGVLAGAWRRARRGHHRPALDGSPGPAAAPVAAGLARSGEGLQASPHEETT